MWFISGLPCPGDSVQDFAVLVKHVQVEFMLIRRDEGVAGLVAAEYRTVHRLHILAAERAGSVHHIVYVAAVLADMLECVDVAAEVHVHIPVPA